MKYSQVRKVSLSVVGETGCKTLKFMERKNLKRRSLRSKK